MDLLKAITGRRSVRFYKKKEVPEKLINQILDKAIWAPSSCNKQAWRFIIIKKDFFRKKLIDNKTAFFVKDAPVLILVLYDNRSDNLEYSDHVQSASALIQNIHLIAHSKGLGSCWVNNLPPKRTLRRLYKIPSFYDPISLITLGYPDKTKPPRPKPRFKEIEELISADYFKFDEKNTSKAKIILGLRKILRKAYHFSPIFIKNKIDPFARNFERRFD